MPVFVPSAIVCRCIRVCSRRRIMGLVRDSLAQAQCRLRRTTQRLQVLAHSWEDDTHEQAARAGQNKGMRQERTASGAGAPLEGAASLSPSSVAMPEIAAAASCSMQASVG